MTLKHLRCWFTYKRDIINQFSVENCSGILVSACISCHSHQSAAINSDSRRESHGGAVGDIGSFRTPSLLRKFDRTNKSIDRLESEGFTGDFTLPLTSS